MVKKGYKQTEIGVIPEDWEVKPLKVVAPLQRGFDLPYSSIKDGIYPVVFSNGIGAYHSSYMVKGPGVVMGRSGTIGKIHYVKSDYWPHNTTLWVTDFHNNDPLFASYLFKTIPWNLYNSGSGVPTLNRNDVQDYLVAIPPPKEQTEIAAILSDVDTLINSLKRQIVKKKAIKQGAMQELLTGKRRLPGFNGAWQVVKLEDICSKITDGSHESPPESDIGYYMPSVKDMRSTGFDYSECKKISYSDFKKLERNGCRPDVGDVLIAKDGSILKYAFVQEKAENIVILSSIAIVTPHSDRVDSYFLAQYFRQQNFVEQVITSYKSGTGVPRIVLKRFKQIVLFIPESVAEQAAIAKILVDMDIEITGLEKELAKYRQVKQGMMQQLLTGKIRLV